MLLQTLLLFRLLRPAVLLRQIARLNQEVKRARSTSFASASTAVVLVQIAQLDQGVRQARSTSALSLMGRRNLSPAEVGRVQAKVHICLNIRQME